MKKIVQILFVLAPLFLMGQTDTFPLIIGGGIVDWSGADYSLTESRTLHMGSNSTGSFFTKETSGREIKDVTTVGDTLFVIIDDWEWEFGPNFGCLVMGCKSDHKLHDYYRLVFLIQPDRVEFIRREVQVEEAVQVTKNESIKRWVEKH